MTLIADILLAAGAIGAGFYCLILSRRLARFTDLEKGVGGAVAVLSVQVDELTKVLAVAQEATANSSEELEKITEKADVAADRLELLLSSIQPESETPSSKSPRVVRRSRRADPEPAKELV